MAKHILLVEDDPFIVDIYARQFKKDGFLVSIANDGQMAWEKIQNRRPDLLVLDIILPKMNGWDLLKMIRSDQKVKDLKVVVVSNNNRETYADNIISLGVLKYFLKIETTPEEITKGVKEILK